MAGFLADMRRGNRPQHLLVPELRCGVVAELEPVGVQQILERPVEAVVYALAVAIGDDAGTFGPAVSS